MNYRKHMVTQNGVENLCSAYTWATWNFRKNAPGISFFFENVGVWPYRISRIVEHFASILTKCFIYFFLQLRRRLDDHRWTRFNRHSFLASRLETWDWKMLGTEWDRCFKTIRNIFKHVWISSPSSPSKILDIHWFSFSDKFKCTPSEDASCIALWGSRVDRARWRRLDSVRGVAPAVWWCHGGAEWNDAIWKADRLIVVSTFLSFGLMPSSPVQLINFEICWKGSSFCLYWVLPFFTWKFSGFCQTTRSSEIHNDCSCFDVTPQDLGVLKSCWLTAAMAPHQQWLSQGMVLEEEKIRKFLGSSGSGCPDAMVAKETRVTNVRWNLKRLVAGWERYMKSTAEIHWRSQLLKLENYWPRQHRNWQLSMKMIVTVLCLILPSRCVPSVRQIIGKRVWCLILTTSHADPQTHLTSKQPSRLSPTISDHRPRATLRLEKPHFNQSSKTCKDTAGTCATSMFWLVSQLAVTHMASVLRWARWSVLVAGRTCWDHGILHVGGCTYCIASGNAFTHLSCSSWIWLLALSSLWISPASAVWMWILYAISSMMPQQRFLGNRAQWVGCAKGISWHFRKTKSPQKDKQVFSLSHKPTNAVRGFWNIGQLKFQHWKTSWTDPWILGPWSWWTRQWEPQVSFR